MKDKKTKKTQVTQTIQELAKIQQIQHANDKGLSRLGFFISIFFIALIASGFYAFEYSNNFSDKYTSALKEFRIVDKQLKTLQDSIYTLYPDGPMKASFAAKKSERNKVLADFKVIQKEEKFLGFKSFQLWLGEYGHWQANLAFGIFILINLLFFKFSVKSQLMVLASYLMGCMFFLGWIFQVESNFSRATYYFMTFISAILITWIGWLIFSKRQNKFEKVADQKRDWQLYVYKNCKTEKDFESMTQILLKHQKELKSDA